MVEDEERKSREIMAMMQHGDNSTQNRSKQHYLLETDLEGISLVEEDRGMFASKSANNSVQKLNDCITISSDTNSIAAPLANSSLQQSIIH